MAKAIDALHDDAKNAFAWANTLGLFSNDVPRPTPLPADMRQAMQNLSVRADLLCSARYGWYDAGDDSLFLLLCKATPGDASMREWLLVDCTGECVILHTDRSGSGAGVQLVNAMLRAHALSRPEAPQ